MSDDQIRSEGLLLALRDHTIHGERVRVRATLGHHDPALVNQGLWLVEVERLSDGVLMYDGRGVSLDIAVSSILRECNQQRDAKVLELRRQVAKLTGNPEVGP